MTSLHLILYVNDETYDSASFDNDSIKKSSKITSIQVSQKDPVFVKYWINSEMLLDETQLFQLGDVRETKFYSHVDELKQYPTSWNTYPTKEDPTKKYKFFSLDI